AISMEPALICQHEHPDLMLLSLWLNAEDMQRKAVFVHWQINGAHEQARIAKNRCPPDAGTARFQPPQAALGDPKQPRPEFISNIPERNFGFLQRSLPLPDALGIEAAIDAQAQLDQQGQVALARHYGRA